MDQKQQIYQSQNLNEDMVQKYLQQNFAGVDPLNSSISSMLMQINPNRGKEGQKQRGDNISHELLSEMYEALFYVGDLQFALYVAEILYSRVRLNQSPFLNANACSYFCNKKNMLAVEMLESIYLFFNKNKLSAVENLTSIQGRTEIIGNKNMYQVFVFTSTEPLPLLQAKVIKKERLLLRENSAYLLEGDFVLLTSCSPSPPTKTGAQTEKEQAEGAPTKADKSPFASYAMELLPRQTRPTCLVSVINEMKAQISTTTAEAQQLYQTVTEKGQHDIDQAVVAYIREVQKDYQIKLFVLPTFEQSMALQDKARSWKMTKLVSKINMDRCSAALESFCTEVSLSRSLLSILLSPPSSNQEVVRILADSIVTEPTGSEAMTNLNLSQKKALRCASAKTLTLIQGPPGSGKTTTAVHVVGMWSRQYREPILACAESNAACNLLHQEFLRAGLNSVRIGVGSDENTQLASDSRFQTYQMYKQQG